MTKAPTALGALVAALALPAGAAAHVSIHPNEVPAGAFATLDVRVPGEQPNAHVTEVDMQVPPGFIGVGYQPIPGWRVKIIESRLAKPVTEGGETIDSQVSQIVWHWTGPDNQIGAGQFIDLPLSAAIPAGAAGRSLQFKTVQRYSNGQVVRWIEGGLEEEHPAPRILVSAPGGALLDQAGAEAGPTHAVAGSGAPASATVAAKASNGASKGLALAALVLGALGLLAAMVAIGSGRRRRNA